MSPAARRAARAALDAARPAVARLDPKRGPEDLAADLIEIWNAVEAALRALVGGSPLTGQALIKDARQRQVLTFDQANALAAFHASRERLDRADYRPRDDDVAVARDAFLKLDAAVVEPEPLPAPANIVVPAPTAAPAAGSGAVSTTPAQGGGRRRAVVWSAVVVAVLVVIGGGWWMYSAFGSRPDAGSVSRGIADYTNNQREAAVGDFNKAVREDPTDPTPHVYLARMAREVGNYPLTLQELQAALHADPHHELALREMGAYFLAIGNYDLARRFYIDALKVDENDKTALGYLGCSLAHLGRPQEAGTFFGHAGPGPWSACASATPASPPGATVPNPLAAAPH